MKNISMLSVLLLALSVCAASAAPTATTRNSGAKPKAPAKPAVSQSTMVLPAINVGGPLSLSGTNPLAAGNVVVTGPGGTLTMGGVSYPSGTYVVGNDGKLVPLTTSVLSRGLFKK